MRLSEINNCESLKLILCLKNFSKPFKFSKLLLLHHQFFIKLNFLKPFHHHQHFQKKSNEVQTNFNKLNFTVSGTRINRGFQRVHYWKY